jgi:hypothetical protein
MVEALATFGRTLGFSFAAGINLYATVALLGLASRYGWVSLPAGYQVFDNSWIIGGALVLYVVEFFADKVPWLDSVWDTLHTAIRPLGGAFIAVTTLGDASPTAQVLVGLLGGTVAASSHFTKAGTRVVANSSPEPFSNWLLSLGEDAFVVALGYMALHHPLVALGVSVTALAIIGTFAAVIVRAVRRRFSRARAEAVMPTAGPQAAGS